MKPPLFIHIGTHKTGSTAIQRALPVGGAAALKEGLVRLDHHGDISRANWTDSDAEALASGFRRQMLERPARYLLTCEGFCGDPYQGYAGAPLIASRLRAATLDFDVSIVIFLRRQDDFIESIYTQLIHQGGSLSFDAFLRSLPPGGLDWHRLLETYAAEFGRERLIVRRYHHDFYPKPESLLEDFCSILGVSPASLEKKKASATPNQGYSREAQEIALLCNAHLDADDRKALRSLLQKISPKPVFQNYSYLDLPARQRLLETFAAGNAAVLRDYFGGGTGGALFPPPEAAPDTDPPSDVVPLTVILVKMLLDLHQTQRGSRLVRLAASLDKALRRMRGHSTSR
ncbi:MAG TPA: hypothetical protein DIT64_01990 [Verrucomicrobiales bacterium]|nr:hypothetical protein [Verrucomicrobiales bacterium]